MSYLVAFVLDPLSTGRYVFAIVPPLHYRWFCRVSIFALAVILVMVPVSEPLQQLFAGERHIECCCGPHSVHDPCDCPDCPALEDRSESAAAAAAINEHGGSAPMSFRQCGQDGDELLSIHHVDWSPANADRPPPLRFRDIPITSLFECLPGPGDPPLIPPS